MIDFVLLIALAVLFVLDGYTTFVTLNSGRGVEVNPLLRWLFHRFGVAPVLVVTKVIAGLLIYSGYLQGATWVLLGLLVVYLWIVWNNWGVLRG